MRAVFRFFHIKKTTFLLFLPILILLLFLRLYHAELNLGFGHDEDLGAWIAKDVIIDHNFRLIGQETSVGGVFIGPLFYYLQAVYFAAFNMDPVGGFYLTLTISILTLFSIFHTVRRFFGEPTALIASLIYAGSMAMAGHDTWIVPTQPTILWTVWFLFALFHIVEEKNPKILLLLGLLLGLIWYVHIAFIPLVALVFLALFISKKKLPLKEFLFNKYSFIGAAVFLILMAPFFVFEMRHDFMQTKGLINSQLEIRTQTENRLFKVYDGASWSFMNIIYEIWNTKLGHIRIIQAAASVVFILMLSVNAKTLGKKGWIIYAWLGITILSQLVSKRPVSEYYFTNLTILEILTIALFLNRFTKNKFSRGLVFLALIIFVIFNIKSALAQRPDGEGYLARKRLVSFIAQDAKKNGYPCIAVNYMTSPGKNAGFRYFFWWNGLDLIQPGGDVAVYSILNPAVMAENEIAKKEGVLGVILPDNPKIDPATCKDPHRQLLPLWGFNN